MRIALDVPRSIALAILVVNALPATAAPNRRELNRFFAHVISSGKTANLDKGRASFLDLPSGTREKYEDLYADEDSSDGFDHGCELFMLRGDDRVDQFVLRVSTMADPTQSDSYYFKLSPDGNLERIVRSKVSYKDDKPIRGSGKSQVMPLDTPGMTDKLQHELDFWLKGKYRKKKPKSK